MSLIHTLFRYGLPPRVEDYRERPARPALEGGWRLNQTTGPLGTIEGPLVSVVTVVRNGAGTLGKTIASVREQSYRNIEYVIIDGGSTDGTLDVIRENEDMIAYWRSEADSGIYDGFNKGVAATSGDYIGILNSDDWMSVGQISRAVDTIRERGSDFAFGDIWLHGWQGKDVRIQGDPAYGGVIRRDMPRLYQATALCSRRMFEEIGLFRTTFRIAADYDWFIRAHLAGFTGAYDSRIVAHMMSGGISTTRQRLAVAEGFAASYKNGYDFVPCLMHWGSRFAYINGEPCWLRNVKSRMKSGRRRLSTAWSGVTRRYGR